MATSTPPEDGLNGAVAAVLRGERAASGMTIDELSHRSGIPHVTVQRLLAARRPLSFNVFESLCHGLGVAPEAVMTAARRRQRRGDPELVQRVLRGVTGVTSANDDVGVTPSTESS